MLGVGQEDPAGLGIGETADARVALTPEWLEPVAVKALAELEDRSCDPDTPAQASRTEAPVPCLPGPGPP